MVHNKPLDPDRIEANLNSKWKLVFFKSTASTNDIAWEYSKGSSKQNIAVIAENQTAGRGRRSNYWYNENGMSLLCSVLLKNNALSSELLTLTFAVALCDAIHCLTGIIPRIKWPNDIFIGDKKVAGILIESRANKNVIDYVVGFGINCNQGKEFFEKTGLDSIATSLCIESNELCDRDMLAAYSLDSISKWLNRSKTKAESVVEKWRSLSSQLGHRITVESNNKRFSGQCINVDPARGLVLQLDRGGVRMFDAAHTTIVKK